MRRTLAACCLAATLSLPAHAEYFLDARQKGELILRGEITGRDEALYNVWIVPGYEQPVQHAAEGWRDAGHALARYGEGTTYRRAAKHAGDAFRYSRRDILGDFAFRGAGRTWRNAFVTAKARVDKRVFGWWFAYPWALLEATTVSALRVGTGVPVGVTAAAGSVTALPLVELSFPLLAAGYHGTVDGVALPVVAAGWNTVVAPPLALLGQQPAAERADGFWMKRIDPMASDQDLRAVREALAAWRERQLATATAQAVTAGQAMRDRDIRAEREAFLRRSDAELAASRQQAQAALLVLLRTGVTDPALPPAAQLAALAQRYGRDTLERALRGSQLDAATARALLDTLLGGQAVAAPAALPLRPDAERTDPLRRGVELMLKEPGSNDVPPP